MNSNCVNHGCYFRLKTINIPIDNLETYSLENNLRVLQVELITYY